MGYLNRSKVYSQFAGILVALLLSTLGAQANSLPDFVRVIIPSPSKLQISGIITLTADEGYYMCPKWSPDGRNIAFTQAKFVGIEVMNSDGSQRRVLTDELGAGYKFSWSADSKEIAYRVNRPVNGERYSIIKRCIFILERWSNYPILRKIFILLIGRILPKAEWSALCYKVKEWTYHYQYKDHLRFMQLWPNKRILTKSSTSIMIISGSWTNRVARESS